MRLLLVAILLLAMPSLCPAVQLPGEGADAAIAGAGTEPGHFGGILAIAFGPTGRLYVLDLTAKDEKTHEYASGGRVQVFEHSGRLLTSFPVVDASLGERDTPSRLAVDATGAVYVAKPKAGRVQRYIDGAPERAFAVPSAYALAIGSINGHETLVVIGSAHEIVDGKWAWLGGDVMHLITPSSGADATAPLARRLFAVRSIAIGAGGDIHVLANDSEPDFEAGGLVLVFGADGALKRSFGLGGKSRVEDGSELLHSVAVDKAGHIYAMTWGNPGQVVRYDADGAVITTRPGQFAWAYPWSVHSSYTPMAIDPDDRLWIASTPQRSEAERDSHPAILRVRQTFFSEDGHEVRRHSAQLLGFKPEIRTALPYDVAYDPGEIAAQVVFPAGRRNVHTTDAVWRVLDGDKQEVASGHLTVALTDQVEASAPFSFRVPRFGWYLIECRFTVQGSAIDAIVKSIGVTPRFPGMPVLEAGTSPGGWEDIPRSVFCGLPNVRLHPHHGKLDELAALAELGKKDGATILVQLFEAKNQIDAEFAQQVVTRLKGLVTTYELVNEPNFTMSPEELAALAKTLTPALKRIDPAIRVMGPTVCGMDLGWIERFFAAGGGPFIDIVAIHDYEGHESISPEHWRYKFAELHRIMAAHGHADSPIWQTERAISVIRGDLLTPMTQVARLTLQSDLLETLGVPREHNNHYYLNEGGFDSVPSYVWSQSGPFPAALASRTRQAMVGGRRYDGQLDFGPSGNALFLGLRHVGGDGSTLTLRNLGTSDRALDCRASGATVEIVDAWGNRRTQAVVNGQVRLSIGQLPCYLRLTPGQTVTPATLDLGRNIAASATISYSGSCSGDLSWLTNGIIESYHAGNPLGGTGGERIWTGAPPTPSTPRILELRWPSPRALHAVMVYGIEADNGFCALIDYDLELETAPGVWTLVEAVRMPLPPSDLVRTAKTMADTWYVRSNRFAHVFAPVQASAVRLLVRRTTFGFAPDEIAAGVVRRAWGGCPAAATMLREIEIYAAPSPVQVSVSAPGTAAGHLPATISVTATGLPVGAACQVALRLPAGWSAAPDHQAIGAGAAVSFTVTPPAAVPAGTLAIDAVIASAGAPLATEACTMQIAAPLEARIEALPAPSQPLAVTLVNHAERPLSGTARLVVAGIPQGQNDQPFGPVGPGARISVTWPLAGIALGAGAVTAQVTTVAAGISATASRDLAVREWQVLAPFTGDDRDAALVAAIEQGRLDLGGSYPDALGTERRWTVTRSPAEHPERLDLGGVARSATGATAYAVIWIRSPAARRAHLAVQGTDCTVRAWWNADLVPPAGADGASTVGLTAGWNRLLLATSRTGGTWIITTLLRDDAGDPMREVQYASKPGP
jgi:hypothetical protein